MQTPATKQTILGSAELERKLRALARELVQNIRDDDAIRADYGLSKDEYDQLVASPRFKAFLRDSAQEWEGVDNIKTRIAVKAAALVEQALPEMFGELTNKSEPLSSRTNLLQSLAKLGGLGQDTSQQRTGDVFRLELNFGKGHDVVIENALPTRVIDAEPVEDYVGDD